jgi:hypothetical protein
MDAWVRVAPGELIDRITILELKLARLPDADRRAQLAEDLERLRTEYRSTCAREVDASEALAGLVSRLREINCALWDSENEVRRCEQCAEFGPRFVLVARSIYRNNDERARVKGAINDLLGWQRVDEKVFDAGAP